MSVLPALMLRSLAFVILTGALALGVALGGCGEEGTTAGSSQSTVAQAPEAGAGQETQAQGQDDGDSPASERGSEGGPGEAAPQGQAGGAPDSPAIHTTPGTPGYPTPGTKAPAPGVPVTSGGDNSVQTFGEEGEEGERQQAEANLRSYLDARVRGDWPGACEAASKQFSEELEKLIEQAKAKPGAEKPEGCAETLELLLSKTPASTLAQAAQIQQVLSFRIRDDGYAYLIFESQGEVKFIAMANDNGTWKVNVPEPDAFQASQGEAQ